MAEFTVDSSPLVGKKAMPSGDSGELAGQVSPPSDDAGEPFADALRESMDNGEADGTDGEMAEKKSSRDEDAEPQAAFLPLSAPVEDASGILPPMAATLVPPSPPVGQSSGFGGDGVSAGAPSVTQPAMTTLAVALKAEIPATPEPFAADDPAASTFDSLLADLPSVADEPGVYPRGFDGMLSDARLATRGAGAGGAPSGALVSTHVDTPLGQSGWGDAFADKISWLVGKQVQQASIHITPEHLGPIEVSLRASQDQLSVTVAAQYVATLETLAVTMSRLREALAGTPFSQIDLQMANPGFTQADPSGQQAASGGRAGGGLAGEHAGLAADSGPEVLGIESRGLLDDYA